MQIHCWKYSRRILKYFPSLPLFQLWRSEEVALAVRCRRRFALASKSKGEEVGGWSETPKHMLNNRNITHY